MKLIRWTTIFTIILVISLGLGSGLVFSQTSSDTDSEIENLNNQIEARREKIKKLEESIEKVKKDINSKRLEAVSLNNQLAILENRTLQVELDIETTQEKMDTLQLEIDALELEIEQKEFNIDRQKGMIAEFIRTIHQQGSRDYLEILAAYDNFSDFYNRIQYLETIEEDIARSAQTLKLAKVDLEDRKTKTEDRKGTYVELKERLDQRKTDLEEQVFQKEDLLTQTRSSELTFQTLLGNLRSQYQSIENEISSFERQVRDRLNAQQKLERDAGVGSGFSWPTQSRYVTARFHDPDYPYRHVFEHSGIDIRAAQGTAIRATAPGYVGRAKRCNSSRCYSYVMLIHADGFATLYGHTSNILVSEDQFVTRGDIIAYSGGTPGTIGAGPFVTGPHLHFEIRKNGIPVNPLNHLIRDY